MLATIRQPIVVRTCSASFRETSTLYRIASLPRRSVVDGQPSDGGVEAPFRVQRSDQGRVCFTTTQSPSLLTLIHRPTSFIDYTITMCSPSSCFRTINVDLLRDTMLALLGSDLRPLQRAFTTLIISVHDESGNNSNRRLIDEAPSEVPSTLHSFSLESSWLPSRFSRTPSTRLDKSSKLPASKRRYVSDDTILHPTIIPIREVPLHPGSSFPLHSHC
jgi:hypothetical protein